MENEIKRVFFGMDISAPWPDSFPKGRVLTEENRHLTLAFLGNVDVRGLFEALPTFPTPEINNGFVGVFDRCLFFPKKRPRVATWHVTLLSQQDIFADFVQKVQHWLVDLGYRLDEREYVPHVTLSRSPFEQQEWKKDFYPIPLILNGIHLYESKGNLNYTSIWNKKLAPPIVEIEHTADRAFIIKAFSFKDLYLHSLVALAFYFPPLLDYRDEHTQPETLNDVIYDLNIAVSKADSEIGTPFKAVSYHGELIKTDKELIWEMIVDV